MARKYSLDDNAASGPIMWNPRIFSVLMLQFNITRPFSPTIILEFAPYLSPYN